MDTVTMLAAMLMGWVFAVVTLLSTRRDLAEQRAAHAQELERRDIREQQLLDQLQLNTQNLPYYPTLGPFTEPEPDNRRYLADPAGYLVIPEDDLAEALAEVDRLGE